MRLITARTIVIFAEEHASARQPLSDWRAAVEAATWQNADAVRASMGLSARPIGQNRFVFNIKGNDFRLVAEIRYADPAQNRNGIVYVQFVGTHAEYDSIDALTISPPSRSPK